MQAYLRLYSKYRISLCTHARKRQLICAPCPQSPPEQALAASGATRLASLRFPVSGNASTCCTTTIVVAESHPCDCVSSYVIISRPSAFPRRTKMQRIETSIPGVYELRPSVFEDARGFFMETYHAEKFRELGFSDVFVQDNHSRSARGTVRGLHYQLNRPQAKLCRVVEGEALDVAVDIRLGSPTFGKWASVKLSAATHNLIYVPAGFAHGFLTLTDSVQFLYKCSDFYFKEDEHGVLWSDPDIKISWGIDSPLVSDKDSKFPRLSEISRDLLPRYPFK